MKWIEDHVPSTHRKLVRHLLPQFIAAEIVNLPTKEERRAWMDAIPDDADPDWTKALVGQMVKVMWKARAK